MSCRLYHSGHFILYLSSFVILLLFLVLYRKGIYYFENKQTKNVTFLIDLLSKKLIGKFLRIN